MPVLPATIRAAFVVTLSRVHQLKDSPPEFQNLFNSIHQATFHRPVSQRMMEEEERKRKKKLLYPPSLPPPPLFFLFFDRFGR